MRLFFAVEIGSPAREALDRALEELLTSRADVRWSHAPWHLTLAFLGETAQERVSSALRAAGRAAARAAPFPAALAGLGVFDSWSRPKVVWMGLADGNLPGLAVSLQGELRAEGFRLEDRPFVPHVTLGRFRSPRGAAALRRLVEARGVEPSPFEVEEMVLLESRLTPSGAEHQVLSHLPLGARA